jgi:DNA helicase-2/ATP-dependent DNA helicase PcrA
MPLQIEEVKTILLDERLNDDQRKAVQSSARRLLVVAGAGSGKTEVMARRVVWWVAVDEVPKDQIVAFTFTDAAAEELKFRIRKWMEKVSAPGEVPNLGGMYIGTIHGFCVASLREQSPDDYYNFDILDDAGRTSLVEQGFRRILNLHEFWKAALSEQKVRSRMRLDAIDLFLRGYDLLNEYNLLDVSLSSDPLPVDVSEESAWCEQAALQTPVGDSATAQAFAVSAARYYAYLKARRFLDFSTSQSELMKAFSDNAFEEKFKAKWKRLVVDEVQDINQVQYDLIQKMVGTDGYLTAVGDHRQAIYSFRGGRVDLMGEIYQELQAENPDNVIELAKNYRSTERIINIANSWSDTIQDTGGMSNPHMEHGNTARLDRSDRHIGASIFHDREAEATWLAETIQKMVSGNQGAAHDDGDNDRGITYSDIAILLRSTTDIRLYQDALRNAGIPTVVRGGTDLFGQPEVLLLVGALGVAAGISQFYGFINDKALPKRIEEVLGINTPVPENVLTRAAAVLQERGIPVSNEMPERLKNLCIAIHKKLNEDGFPGVNAAEYKCKEAAAWLNRGGKPRRVFPQQIFHWILEEAEVGGWRTDQNQSLLETALFHIGQLSSLIKGVETSGWTTAFEFQSQIFALLHWGSLKAKIPEAPLLVSPDAVGITTIHASKGLEFPVVFLVDCKSRRFPSSKAKMEPNLPFEGDILQTIQTNHLKDNDNYDDERRLMYVALTRAERYLFVSSSSWNRSPESVFLKGERRKKGLQELITLAGRFTATVPQDISGAIDFLPAEASHEFRLTTSFSDLRYFLECPHDFYMRKVLGFTPTIGQEFGYGRGVHNLLRVVHSAPQDWAQLAENPETMKTELERLIQRGLFYLRYTTGDPLENLRRTALKGVGQYIQHYAPELEQLHYEPEKEFETLIEDEGVLISGAIDVVRLDDPPRVTIIDFKSGDSDESTGSGLTRDMMAQQIGVYGLAAKHELEYEPQKGLVRYIGENDHNKRETRVELSPTELESVRNKVIETTRKIKGRDFDHGPVPEMNDRCKNCDFLGICNRHEARTTRGQA